MPRELLLPKLGLTMSEGSLVEWLVKPGERFRAGQSLFVIESEKAAVEIPAETDGRLLDVVVELGVVVPVGTVVGHWDNENAEATALASAAEKFERTADIPRVRSTPLARRLAHERGIELAGLKGTGPLGRIRTRDLPDANPAPQAKKAAAEIPAALCATVLPASGADTSLSQGQLRPATAIEQTIARRLVAAKQEIPHFYLAVEAEVSVLQKLRAELNAAQTELRFTLNHFIVAAVGRALADMPEVNCVWTPKGLLCMNTSDVGVAVHSERGLTVPVLSDVGRRTLSQVARDASTAITRAQAGRLTAQEMAGGSITVSNAGMHDVTYMASIINPGQSMILGVGSVRGAFRPGEDDAPVLCRELGMVLSADHRVLDGVTALKFLKHIVTLLEQPLVLCVA